MTTADVIVLGGGPGATVCAIELARRGRRVTLLDADFTPRYRVGESLSPTACQLLESVGVNLAEAGFVAKQGATFAWGQRPTFRIRYAAATAWQVRRAELDAALLKLAEKAGVEVRPGHRAVRVLFVRRWATGVRLRADDGGVRDLHARWVVDATGRHALLANQLHLLDRACARSNHHLMWSYWRRAGRLPAEAAGDGLFVGGDGQAWWYLPVDERDNVVAVGAMVPGRRTDAPSQDAYLEAVAGTTRIAGMLAAAEHLGPVRVAAAGSQLARRLVGHGWLLVGDAAGFVDPILTPGVQLAVQFGQLAAVAIDVALRDDPRATAGLLEYEQRLYRELSTYRWLADNLYAAAGAPGSGDGALTWGDEQGDRMAFLSLIAGMPQPALAARLGEYLGMRGAAAGYGGAPPVLGETEGFAFLTWLAGKDGHRSQPEDAGTSVRLSANARVEDVHTLADLAGVSTAAPIRAVRTASGDRFLLTRELETLLGVLAQGAEGDRAEISRRFATEAGSSPDPATFDRWLDLLLRHGLLERTPERARADLSRATRAGE